MSKHNEDIQLDDLKELFKARIIQDKLNNLTDMPFSYMDLEGKWVGKPSRTNYSVFKLVYANKVGRAKYLECDRKHKDAALASGKADTYVSQTGLTNFIVPININGRSMGVIIGGQVLLGVLGEIDDPMRNTLLGIAEDLQIDESEILIAAKEIQIKKKSDIDNAIKIIEVMIPYICELELKRIEEKRQREKKDNQIASLQTVGIAITSNLDLDQVLKKIVKSAKEVLSADVITLYQYEQETNEFTCPPLVDGLLFERRIMECPTMQDDVLYKILKTEEIPFADDAVNSSIMFNKNRKGNNFVIHEKIKSSVGLPLRVGDNIVGILFINFRCSHVFTNDEKRIINIFATQAAIAIQNAKMYKRTHKKLKEETEKLNILYEVGEKFGSTFEITHILDLIVEKGKALTGAQKATARLFDPDTNMLLPCASKGKTCTNSRIPLGIGEGILGTAAKEKRSILVPDVSKDKNYICFNEDTMSELAIPMLWGIERELIGVLNFEHPQLDAFNDEHQKLLEALAYSVAIAVKNNKLYNKIVEFQKVSYSKIVKGQKNLIETIHDIERSMNSDDFRLVDLLKKIRDKIVELVNASHGCILGKDDEGKLINLLLCCRIDCIEDCKGRMYAMMTDDVFENHNIIISSDIRKDKRYNFKFKEIWKDTKSIIIVPVPNEVSGSTCILTLSSPKQNAFGSHEIILAKLFAALTAVALNDAKRMMELKERNRWLTLLFDVIIDLKSEPTEMDEIFRHIVDLASYTFHADECCLFMLDESSKKITLRSSLNHKNEKTEQTLSYEIGEGIVGTIVQTRKLIRAKNIQKHSNYSGKYKAYMQKKIPTWECNSFLGVPLIINDKCVGVIQLHNRNRTDDHPYNWFSKEDEDLLSALGDIIGFVIDKARIVRENETMTKKLHQSEKMAAIGSLTAGTTHGFKQPMQIIKNQVDMLKGKKALEQCIDEINIIDNQIHRMYEIINIFSRFSSPEVLDNIDVSILLDQTIEAMILPGNININREVSHTININCDPGQIKQVFENLTLNGCEAMTDGGILKISVITNNGMISITFEDEGDGIPDYAIKKVFDPFFTTKKSKGTGLGLYISKFIVQNHKGNIYLKSGEGKGSIFVVELPTSNHGQWE